MHEYPAQKVYLLSVASGGRGAGGNAVLINSNDDVTIKLIDKLLINYCDAGPVTILAFKKKLFGHINWIRELRVDRDRIKV